MAAGGQWDTGGWVVAVGGNATDGAFQKHGCVFVVCFFWCMCFFVCIEIGFVVKWVVAYVLCTDCNYIML